MAWKNATRRRKGVRYSMLPQKVLADPDVVKQTHGTLRVLALLAGQFNGSNNGALGLTYTQAKVLGVSNKTLYKALTALAAIDVIQLTYSASRTPPRPNMYALSWLPVDDTEFSMKTRTPARKFRASRWP